MKVKKKQLIAATLAALTITSTSAYAAVEYNRTAGPNHGEHTGVTPYNWSLTPAGEQVTLGNFPMGAALSPDGRYFVVSNGGQGTQSLQVVDTTLNKVVHTIPYTSPESLYLGIVFSPDGKRLYASAGGNNKIRTFDFVGGQLSEKEPISLKDTQNSNAFPGGMSISQDGAYLYVANNLDHSVSKIDVSSQKVVKTTAVGKNPYTAFITNDGKSLYVTNWGESSVSLLDSATLEVKKTIPTDLHPNAIAENPKTGDVYISNSDDDTISIINPKSHKVVETILVKPKKNGPTGSQPNSLALSEDGQTLYVANAGNNDIAVLDVSRPKAEVKGLIPTAWYPTGVYLNNKKLLVTNAKGLGAGPNAEGQYVGNMMNGSLSVIDIPNQSQLRQYTKQVNENNTIKYKQNTKANNPIPVTPEGKSPIKHVIYIIKENRTYDQVFGDLEKGNGDPSLTFFGEDVTPNLHKLARDFVTFDNFYATAEISAQGHNWATAAKANDYTEKTWMANYSGRNRSYDWEGDNEASYPKAGFIWNNAQRSDVSYRVYGEFVNFDKKTNQWVATEPSISNNYDANFPGYNLDISDLVRQEAWEKEFQEFVKNDNLPQLQIVRLGNDHTQGTKPGKLSPQAMVAQNDYAVGKLVEAVSQSKYWKDTAIFITEDDAQNGWDHVDAHRTTSLVISPYTQTGKLDSTFYDTTSMLRTMELILGMKPMTQFDASSIPMSNAFTNKPDFTPYQVEEPRYPLDEINAQNAPGAALSKTLDFSGADRADEETLNKVLWKAMMKDKQDQKIKNK
ncbi:bifunctional YncE family protein/alkaline phosphatase family protein [Lederbergia wuyishanensis]|uniref:YVTN family beta-propeller protein n=1 Tax=Lederbergia wuyishanensis TaxID=1347903 RepID=A0ABU0DAB2_9BACI|nr:bifunctional YncE family protein/alkaline phosphatase family protein [Lederbergia wuyishanensis]MCJ8010097.1 bifunctional YncE family protein/alkaline phosphatase family protein [Lederbergia wuyishanensis]MDQ0345336.1 YVTN family beta-propeller protein [Lederbergia wuyishanensis]